MALVQRLAPDLADELALRALVLERIADMGPIGRRQLAQRLNLPEREVRGAAAALKAQGLIELDGAGMTLTPRAEDVLPAARQMSRTRGDLAELESLLAAGLKVERVCMVPGDADVSPEVIQEVGRVAARQLRLLLQNGQTLAVTGGSTVAATARSIHCATPMNVMVVPARGGLGRGVATQANTIAAELAQRIGGHHRLLYLPDHMDSAAMQEMLKLPEVREAMELIQRADVILHGIGCAESAARAGGLPSSVIRRLTDSGAVGEAFGNYFDREGQCLLTSSSVGVDLARLAPRCRMMAVAAGAGKAEAIMAVMRHDPHAVLVTDEGAGRRIAALL